MMIELKLRMAKDQECYQKYADEHRSLATLLKIGDQVYVKAKYFHTTQPLKKLSEKNLGPYKVIAIPGSHSFTLRLLDRFHSIPHLPHIPTRTGATGPISAMRPTPATSSRD